MWKKTVPKRTQTGDFLGLLRNGVFQGEDFQGGY